MTENLCGLCKAKGLKKHLILFQLNLEEAILLCENKECVYPLGVTDNANLIVRRRASDAANLKRKRKKKSKQTDIEEHVKAALESRCLETYLQWQNVNSLCWLHSILSLVVHNVTLSTLTQNVESLLRTVTESFNRAQELSSTNREKAEKTLQDAREEVWRYLQPRMRCDYGVHDSPVTALPLLLRENGTLSEEMLQVYRWKFTCSACGYQQIDKRMKHMVTFPNVIEGFNLQDPAFVRPCYRCGAPNQRSKLVYDRIPQFLLLHFEQGLKQTTFQDLDFQAGDGHYVMTQFIQYKKNPNHFVCWTREPKGKRWMELDDLKSPVCSWRPLLPAIPPSEVHIAVWEKAPTVINSLLSPVTKKTATTDIQEKPVNDIKMDCSTQMISSRPLLNIDCNVNIESLDNVKREHLLPSLSVPSFIPPVSLRSRSLSHGLPQKMSGEQFEPYIPRKKRLVSFSCPNSPVSAKSDLDTSATLLSSPALSQSFLTWQDIKEQNKKINTDDLQSDSGYSSPASVSSCGSLPTGQPIHGDSVSDCFGDLHVYSDEKQGVEPCVDDRLSSKNCSSHDTTIDTCHSVNLANKLEELLPDCLLENHKGLINSNAAKDGKELQLASFEKLSDEQDQFIRDLLAA